MPSRSPAPNKPGVGKSDDEINPCGRPPEFKDSFVVFADAIGTSESTLRDGDGQDLLNRMRVLRGQHARGARVTTIMKVNPR